MKKLIVALAVVVSAVRISMAVDAPVITFSLDRGAFSDIRWDNVAGADDYLVHRATYSGGTGETWRSLGSNFNVGNPDWVQNVEVTATSTDTISFSWDDGEVGGISYYFTIQARDGEDYSALSNEVEVVIPTRTIDGYKIWTGDAYNFTSIATIPAGSDSYTLSGLGRNIVYSYKFSAISSIDASGYGDTAPLSPGVDFSTRTIGSVLDDSHSVALEVSPFISSVTVTISFEGYDGYGGIGYYRLAHSTNSPLVESDFASGIINSITSLVDASLQLDVTYVEGEINYYAIEIVDTYPDVTMVSPTGNCDMISYTVDHFEVSVATTIIAGESFSVTLTGINEDDIAIPLYAWSALIQPVLADDTSMTGSVALKTTTARAYVNEKTVEYFAYTKAERIKIKVTYNSQTVFTDEITINPNTLDDVTLSVSPAHIISGQSADIISYLYDTYGNCIKSVKVKYKIKKGKGTLDKSEETTDVTGKAKVKFSHDEGKPEVVTLNALVGAFDMDAFINVTVLILASDGATIVASSDPGTKVIIPPNALSEDVQLLIKTLADMSIAMDTKVRNAHGKSNGAVVLNSSREFNLTVIDGSEHGDFAKLAIIEIPYIDDDNDDIVDDTDINVNDLKIVRLDEIAEEWEEVTDGELNEVDKERKCVKAHVKHFSTYSIGEIIIPDADDNIVTFGEFKVYPNPINFKTAVGNTLKFNNVPVNTKINIYDVTGREVRMLNSNDANLIEWDGKNNSGSAVSMGLYIYLLTDGNGNQETGKIGITK